MEHPSSGPTSFEAKKRAYFIKLALRFKDLIKVHAKAGQLERSDMFGTDNLTNSDGIEYKKNKRWGNPTEHYLVEAAAAEVVAKEMGLNDADTKNVITAALLHDAQKRTEVEALRGVTDAGVVEEVYDKSKQVIADSGIENSERVTEIISSVAHTSLPKFAILAPDNSITLRQNLDDVEMIMHYIDDVTRGTDLVTLDERMDYLDQVASVRYPYNEEGRAVWGGRTFFEAQREIGHLIEDRLAKKMGVDDPKTLPLYIKKRIEESILAG